MTVSHLIIASTTELATSTRIVEGHREESVHTTTSCLSRGLLGILCASETVLTVTTTAPAAQITEFITYTTEELLSQYTTETIQHTSCTTLSNVDEDDELATSTITMLSLSTPEPSMSASTTTFANGTISVQSTTVQAAPSSVWVPVIQTMVVGRRRTTRGVDKIAVALGVAGGVIVLLAALWLMFVYLLLCFMTNSSTDRRPIYTSRAKRLRNQAYKEPPRKQRFSLDMDESKPFGSGPLTSNHGHGTSSSHHGHASSFMYTPSPPTPTFSAHARSTEFGLHSSHSTTRLLSPPPSFSDHYTPSPPHSPSADTSSHYGSPLRIASPLSSAHGHRPPFSPMGSSSSLMTPDNPSLSALNLHSLRRLPSEADVTERSRSDSPSSVHELPFGSSTSLIPEAPEPASPLRITNFSKTDEDDVVQDYLTVDRANTGGSRKDSFAGNSGQRTLSPIEEGTQSSSDGHGAPNDLDPFSDDKSRIGRAM